jgi:hypothetical protein
VEERYLAALRFFGYSLDEATDFFREFGGAPSGPTSYGLWGSAKRIEEHLTRLRQRYAVLLEQGGAPLNTYRIDYVMVSGDRSERFADGEKQGHLRTVYDDGRFKIFKYDTPGSG